MLGISFDSVAKNKAFAEKYGFPYRLLSDPDRTVGLAYAACASVDAPFANRITYVIGADGTIERAIDTVDPAGQADEILAAL